MLPDINVASELTVENGPLLQRAMAPAEYVFSARAIVAPIFPVGRLDQCPLRRGESRTHGRLESPAIRQTGMQECLRYANTHSAEAGVNESVAVGKKSVRPAPGVQP